MSTWNITCNYKRVYTEGCSVLALSFSPNALDWQLYTLALAQTLEMNPSSLNVLLRCLTVVSKQPAVLVSYKNI